MSEAPLMTTIEVAELLKVRPATVAQWRWRQTGPPFSKVGRRIRYRHDDVVAWLAAGGVTT